MTPLLRWPLALAAGSSLLAGCAATGTEDEPGRVLDAFHRAAAEADGATYFGSFDTAAVFLGTDETERWTVAEFRAYAAPHFEGESAWTYLPTERHLEFSPEGSVAWFDERLANEKYGSVRGSGVLVRRGADWKIAQYVLSFPVPNELAGDLVERVREFAEGAQAP